MKNKIATTAIILLMQIMTGCISAINDAIDNIPSINDLTDPGEIVDSMPSSVNGNYSWEDMTKEEYDAYWVQYGGKNRQPPSSTVSLYEKKKDKPIRLYKDCSIKKTGSDWCVEYKSGMTTMLSKPLADFDYESGAYMIADGHPEMLRYLDKSGHLEIYKEGWLREFTLGSDSSFSFYDIYVYNTQAK